MNVQQLAALIAGYRYPSTTETELQENIANVLTKCGVVFEREVRLNPQDRPDFMVGSIAVEVKIASSKSEVLMQLNRYAQCPEVHGIVLVSNRFRHIDMPASLNEKPICVANLLRGAF